MKPLVQIVQAAFFVLSMPFCHKELTFLACIFEKKKFIEEIPVFYLFLSTFSSIELNSISCFLETT